VSKDHGEMSLTTYRETKAFVGLSGHIVSFLVSRFPFKSGLIHKHIVNIKVSKLIGASSLAPQKPR
jgi:hypothetical protein